MVFTYPMLVSGNVDPDYVPIVGKIMEKYFGFYIGESFNNNLIYLMQEEIRTGKWKHYIVSTSTGKKSVIMESDMKILEEITNTLPGEYRDITTVTNTLDSLLTNSRFTFTEIDSFFQNIGIVVPDSLIERTHLVDSLTNSANRIDLNQYSQNISIVDTNMEIHGVLSLREIAPLQKLNDEFNDILVNPNRMLYLRLYDSHDSLKQFVTNPTTTTHNGVGWNQTLIDEISSFDQTKLNVDYNQLIDRIRQESSRVKSRFLGNDSVPSIVSDIKKQLTNNRTQKKQFDSTRLDKTKSEFFQIQNWLALTTAAYIRNNQYTLEAILRMPTPLKAIQNASSPFFDDVTQMYNEFYDLLMTRFTENTNTLIENIERFTQIIKTYLDFLNESLKILESERNDSINKFEKVRTGIEGSGLSSEEIRLFFKNNGTDDITYDINIPTINYTIY